MSARSWQCGGLRSLADRLTPYWTAASRSLAKGRFWCRPSKGIRRQRAMRSSPQLQDHNPCRRWANPPSDTVMHLDRGFPALAATVGRCFGHCLRSSVEIDGHRIKVAIEEIRMDPQRNAGILVAEHPRHRKDIRAGPSSVVQCLLSGGPYTTAPLVRQCQLVWPPPPCPRQATCPTRT
jgi:hypothetical protein